jgi:hypothetical protein
MDLRAIGGDRSARDGVYRVPASKGKPHRYEKYARNWLTEMRVDRVQELEGSEKSPDAIFWSPNQRESVLLRIIQIFRIVTKRFVTIG